nr:hypothetical protein [Limosilactobacillus mucosae]
MLTPNEKMFVDIAFEQLGDIASALDRAYATENDDETVSAIAIAISLLEKAQEPLIDARSLIRKRRKE